MRYEGFDQGRMIVDLPEKTNARQDKDYDQEGFKEIVQPGQRNLEDLSSGLQVEDEES